MNIVELAKEAGVVGAGGGGFPTHVKIDTQVEYVIANGAECEPLIHKDRDLMERVPQQVVAGLGLVIKATGAKGGIIGIKEKNARAVGALRQVVSGTGIEIHPLDDYYPAGDEFMLVYETTGRLIPPAGIPLEIGIVVNNIESLCNIANAAIGKPVISKFLTVTGAVKNPISFEAPVGISIREAIDIAGGATVDEYSVLVGGPMMGELEQNLDAPITKTTGGLIVLPSKHHLIERKGRTADSMNLIDKSACDQCRFCTDRCHRYLLGYDIQPHKVMRSFGYTGTEAIYWGKWASLCCACGICTLYACPEELYPKEACDASRKILMGKGIQWKRTNKQVKPHIMQEYRRVPIKHLVKRLGLAEYDQPATFMEVDYLPKLARLPLSQHTGAPAEPVVKIGEKVKKGQLIAEIPDGKLGAKIHASIDGTIMSIDSEIIIQGEL
jgi:Na+-translocating ferredoxin:NAD+ oxidoreductase RnfC subunit